MKPSGLLKELKNNKTNFNNWKGYFIFPEFIKTLGKELDKKFISIEDVIKIINKTFNGEFKSLMNKCVREIEKK